MKLAVLSDIHGNLPALEAVVADAEARGCDAFVNLGDSVSGPLWPAETAAFLMARDWPTIAGNQERQLLSLAHDAMGASDRFARARLDDHQLEWLASHPPTLAYAHDVFLCHGTPASDLVYLLEDLGPDGARPADTATVAARIGARPERLILCGHSHRPRVLETSGHIVANPGSVGLPAYADDLPVPHVMEAGTPQARYAVVEAGTVTLLAVDYEQEAAAAKADHEGRPDWAIALRTGRAR